MKIILNILLASVLFGSVPSVLHAQNDVPRTTPEGMELVKQTRSRVVYAMPGASLEQYTKVALIDCYVAFAKDWERDYNRTARLQNRIDDDDMKRIQTDLAAEFRAEFTKVLTNAGHEVVDHTGDDVLIIRPAIINLEVTAPETDASAFDNVIVRSAGQMTLYMELYDSTTNAIIARIQDAQASERGGVPFQANRVSNKEEADRIITEWARELESHLGDAKATVGDDG